LSPILGIIASQNYVRGPLFTSDYESIATVTVGSGGASTINFTSIPSTYKHLQLRGTIRGTRTSTNDILGVQFNSDTSSSNYVSHRLIADGSTVASSSTNSGAYSLNWVSDFPAASATASIFGVFVLDLLDYATSNKNRVGRTLSGYDANGSGSAWLTSQLWINTSSISSISFLPVFGAGFAQYSQIGLYGIKG
jgi:hypothetical protein